MPKTPKILQKKRTSPLPARQREDYLKSCKTNQAAKASRRIQRETGQPPSKELRTAGLLTSSTYCANQSLAHLLKYNDYNTQILLNACAFALRSTFYCWKKYPTITHYNLLKTIRIFQREGVSLNDAWEKATQFIRSRYQSDLPVFKEILAQSKIKQPPETTFHSKLALS